MTWQKKLFGPTLLVKSGDGSEPTPTPTEEVLAGKKFVGVYFSAHIVFSSCDSDLDGFNEYYGMMPWAAVPYEDRERDATLSAKFKVDGVPTLVILDGATGHVVDPDAVGKVSTAKTLMGIFSK